MANDKELATLAKDQFTRFTKALDRGHRDYVTIAKKCEDFYEGKQWDEAIRRKLEEEGRPTLTINEILPTVNAVLGEQSSKRADLVFKPRRGAANEETSAILTKLVMQIMDTNDYDELEGEVFADGVIIERGYFDLRIETDDNLLGEVKVDVLDPLTVVPDPDSKSYDPKEWNEVYSYRWMSLDEIQVHYGKEKADEVESSIEVLGGFGSQSVRFDEESETFGGNDERAGDDNISYTNAETRAIRSIRVINRQHYKLTRVQRFFDAATGESKLVPHDWEPARIQEFAQKYDLEVVERLERRVRWTVTADRVVLHDDWSPYRSFSIVPYFCYHRRGRPFGMVRNLLSPQEQLNKLSSQELHIVNTTANSGWVVEKGSLTNMTVDELTERGAETGLVLEHAPGKNPPQKINANNIPMGIHQLSQSSRNNIREISGVNDGMRGEASAEVSGVALQHKQMRGQIQIQKPLDNLTRTRKLVARKVLELVQDFYTEERIVLITNEEDPRQPREELVINGISPEGEIINDITLGDYDVVVSTMPARDNFNDSQFAEALSMREVGIAIPDHAVIEYSNLRRKGELAEQVKQMQGLGEPSDEEMQAAQMAQKIELQQAQLSLQELAAKIAKLEADALLAQTKAQDIPAQTELAEEKLEQEFESKERDRQLREGISTASILGKETHSIRSTQKQESHNER